jgi:ankyrin repeat protein
MDRHLDHEYQGHMSAQPLFDAVLTGELQLVEQLLNTGAQRWLNTFDDFAFTPLMHACRLNHPDIVRLFLAAGADVNLHDESHIGDTALHEAVVGGGIEVVKLLLEAGADPQIQGWMQLTPMDKARHLVEEEPTQRNRDILSHICRSSE